MKNSEEDKEMLGGCCVCSDENGWPDNPLVYCDGTDCNVAVHQACYGIVSVPTGQWFCCRCEAKESPLRARCELCPSKDGALKRTDSGGWAHVVCALYIPEVRFGNVTTMEPIVLQLIPQDRFNKQCYICEESNKGTKASVGACMQCNKAGCKHYFHVTCAQERGYLCEEAGNYLDNVKYCGYCGHHFEKLKEDTKKGTSVKTIPPYRPPPSHHHSKNDGDFRRNDSSSTASAETGSSSSQRSSSSRDRSRSDSNRDRSGSSSSSSSKRRSGGPKPVLHPSTRVNSSISSSSNSGSSVNSSSSNKESNSSSTFSSAATTVTTSSSSSSSTFDRLKQASIVLASKISLPSTTSSTSSSSINSNSITAFSNSSATIVTTSSSSSKSSSSSSSNNVSSAASSIKTTEKSSTNSSTSVGFTLKRPSLNLSTTSSTSTTSSVSTTSSTSSTTPSTSSTTLSTANTTSIASSAAISTSTSVSLSNPVSVSKVTISNASLITSSKEIPFKSSSSLSTSRAITNRSSTSSEENSSSTSSSADTNHSNNTPEKKVESNGATTTVSLEKTKLKKEEVVPSVTSSVTISAPTKPDEKMEIDEEPSDLKLKVSYTPNISNSVHSSSRASKADDTDPFTPTPADFGAVTLPTLDATSVSSASGVVLPPKRGRGVSIERGAPIDRGGHRGRNKRGGSSRDSNNSGSNKRGRWSVGHNNRGSIYDEASPPSSPDSDSLVAPKRGKKRAAAVAAALELKENANAYSWSPPETPTLPTPSMSLLPVSTTSAHPPSTTPSLLPSNNLSSTMATIEPVTTAATSIATTLLLGNQINPSSAVAQKMTDTLHAELQAHSIYKEEERSGKAPLVGPALPGKKQPTPPVSAVTPTPNGSLGQPPPFPQSLEQLLERQWEQGSQFLMEQAQHFDIASLLSCLHQLRQENVRLEENVAMLSARRDHLLAVNARLSVPLGPSTSSPTHDTGVTITSSSGLNNHTSPQGGVTISPSNASSQHSSSSHHHNSNNSSHPSTPHNSHPHHLQRGAPAPPPARQPPPHLRGGSPLDRRHPMENGTMDHDFPPQIKGTGVYHRQPGGGGVPQPSHSPSMMPPGHPPHGAHLRHSPAGNIYHPAHSPSSQQSLHHTSPGSSVSPGSGRQHRGPPPPVDGPPPGGSSVYQMVSPPPPSQSHPHPNTLVGHHVRRGVVEDKR